MLITNNMGTFTKKIINNELCLYNAKGELIFKRWLAHGYSYVFDVMPYTKNTYMSIYYKNNDIISCKN